MLEETIYERPVQELVPVLTPTIRRFTIPGVMQKLQMIEQKQLMITRDQTNLQTKQDNLNTELAIAQADLQVILNEQQP